MTLGKQLKTAARGSWKVYLLEVTETFSNYKVQMIYETKNKISAPKQYLLFIKKKSHGTSP